MNNIVLILGNPKTGKTYSLRNLPDDETFIFNISAKPLIYESGKKFSDKRGNMVSHMYAIQDIPEAVHKIIEKKPEVKYIVIDDISYSIGSQFIKRATKKGYDRFDELAEEMFKFFHPSFLRSLGEGRWLIVTSHVDDTEDGYKIKAKGKLMRELFDIDGLFDTVLFTNVDGKEKEKEHRFICTPQEGIPASSIYNILDDYEPNDVMHVIKKIENELSK